MASRAREAVAPAYLFLFLILGGSAQGIWQNMFLELIGLGIIAWAAWAATGSSMARPARDLLTMALVAVALIAIQLVPLPVSAWTNLGGREAVAAAEVERAQAAYQQAIWLGR